MLMSISIFTTTTSAVMFIPHMLFFVSHPLRQRYTRLTKEERWVAIRCRQWNNRAVFGSQFSEYMKRPIHMELVRADHYLCWKASCK